MRVFIIVATVLIGFIMLSACEDKTCEPEVVVVDCPVPEEPEVPEVPEEPEIPVPPVVASFYVAPNGLDSNAGSITKPFKTLEAAGKKAKPGDTILVRGGVYPGQRFRDISGTAGKPITFKAYPGEKPIFDGRHGVFEKIVFLVYGNVNYVTFDGLTVTDSGENLKAARKLDLTKEADALIFQSKHLPLINRGIRVSPKDGATTTDITFRNMTVHTTGDMAFSINDRVANVTVEDSLVYDVGYPMGYGIYYHGNGLIFRRNVIRDTVYAMHIYDKSSNMTVAPIIEGNHFSNVGMGSYWHVSSRRVKTGGGGILVDDPGSGAIIRNNIIHNCGFGINASLPNAKVYNNLVYDCRSSISVSDTGVEVINNVTDKPYTLTVQPKVQGGAVISSSVKLVDEKDASKGVTGKEILKGKGAVSPATHDFNGVKRSGNDVGPFEI